MKPLEGIRVLDLSRVLSGPYCTMTLGDLGAEIIKVEQPGSGDDTRSWGPPDVGGQAAYFLSINRNKKSVTVDMKKPEGLAIIHKLAEKSDVVVENFRPGTADKLGVGYKDMMAINPRLVYCSISGFGQTGPYSHKPGYDAIAQAMGGIMSVTGEPGRLPVRAGAAIADIGSGMWALVGILAALQAREKTGRGQWVDTSLIEGQISWLTYVAGNYFATEKVPQAFGSAHPNIVPYQAFATMDGSIMVAVGNDGLWKKFAPAIGLADMVDDPRYSTNRERVARREEVLGVIGEKLKGKTSAEWTEILEGLGIPVGPINNLADVFHDPHVLAREMLVEMDHPTAGRIKMTGVPVKFSETPARAETPPPLLGQHTDEVLTFLGYPPEGISQLKERGVV